MDLKTREMIIVASLISLGNVISQLELHLKNALNVGVTKNNYLRLLSRWQFTLEFLPV
ncbi:carboxymuconolactone decarboxylase family protein [Citrobacter sp. Ct235]|uniref:carboxymuconolactone decarboxylase family protein n=1 Tax=Citrobacter sp. Ct235 TaxID=2985157 RepID=UPI0025782D18|nr:carboxymuconolactone decarboxylase family protein [Citrobacter sp. Ct235]MDM2734720.1 carboxymuconolactone decarboxylase family protein [Citrobacter sp. Ct235]